MDWTGDGARCSKTQRRGFSLLELLAVIAIIGLLAALLLPALSKAKAHAHNAGCKNQLRQIGIALRMYLSDFNRYPPLWDNDTSQVCFDKLVPYNPLVWTNTAWHCPAYIRNHGLVFYRPNEIPDVATSYAYNWRGMASGGPGTPRSLQLGLGHLSKDSPREPEVSAPCEMYTVGDVRPTIEGNRLLGNIKMTSYSFGTLKEAPPPHGQGYNVLFGDGHVALVKRRDFLFPPRSAPHWHRDNQPHPEVWAPKSQWAVQE
ncbi:MAG TPA: DUF1559 domain-containing protein [Bacillota bacterium]|nr:DUF1559 domain-containing protein [Bacillota bacterium]